MSDFILSPELHNILARVSEGQTFELASMDQKSKEYNGICTLLGHDLVAIKSYDNRSGLSITDKGQAALDSYLPPPVPGAPLAMGDLLVTHLEATLDVLEKQLADARVCLGGARTYRGITELASDLANKFSEGGHAFECIAAIAHIKNAN